MPERLIGETLGRYRVEALVGSGGFAWVYRAFDPELEIPVALKVLKPQYAGDAEFEARFRREASTAAKLRHPNIVKIFAVGKENNAVYFAMDYLPRGLADRLEAMPVLPEATVVRAGLDVAKALAFAHREGVVHRDIKVDNILFDDHGNAVVADFGIARAVAEQVRHTQTNMVVGTPQYFSPEQARGLDLDGRSDIYSLGVTLYRAATGRLPFEGEDWYTIARQHVEDPPPPMRALNPALSTEFEQVVLRCLGKKPEQRYASADELAEHLEMLRHPSVEMTAARTQMMAPFQGAETPIRSAAVLAGTQERRRRTTMAGIAAAAVLVAGSVAAFYDRGDASAPGTPALPERPGPAPIGVIPDNAAPVPPVRTAADSVDSVAAERARLAAQRPVLTVVTVPGSVIRVNRKQVAPRGVRQWIGRDTLAPGTYRVEAALEPAPAGCATARDERIVELNPGDKQRVQLNPRSCGTLMIDARVPAGVVATYALLSDARESRSGRLPLAAPLVLPAGHWSLRIDARPQCFPFDEPDIQMRAGAPIYTVRARLECGAN